MRDAWNCIKWLSRGKFTSVNISLPTDFKWPAFAAANDAFSCSVFIEFKNIIGINYLQCFVEN